MSILIDVLYLTDNGTWKLHPLMNFGFPSCPLSFFLISLILDHLKFHLIQQYEITVCI